MKEQLKKIEKVLDVDRTNGIFDSLIRRSKINESGEMGAEEIKKIKIFLLVVTQIKFIKYIFNVCNQT